MNRTPGPVERIDPVQFFWWVASSVVAGGIYLWPQPALRTAGADWPWALTGTLGLAWAGIWLQIAWGRRAKGLSLAQRLQDLWGWAAWPWLIGSLAGCTAVDAALLALFGDMLHAFFYPATPTWLLDLLLAGVAVWLALQSLATAARNVQVWLPLVIFSYLFLGALVVPQARDPGAVTLPWPPAPGPVVEGILASWFLWSQGDLILTAGPWVRGATWGSLGRVASAAFFAQAAITASVGALVVASLGPWAARLIPWPLIYVMVNLGPMTASFARPGLLLLPTWSAAMVAYLTTRMLCAGLNLTSALGAPAPHRALVTGLIGGTVLVLAATAPAAPQVYHLLVQVVSPLALAWFLTVHLATVAVALMRRRPPAPGPEVPD